MAKVSILFITTGLYVGGAEMMLHRLLSRLDPTRFNARVISLIALGPVSDKIRSLGVPVDTLDMTPGRPTPASVLGLARVIRRHRPDVIQTWMYHADLLGALATRLAGRIPMAWGIRHSDPGAQGYGPFTSLTIKVCARLSRWIPKRIVCCSEASRLAHAAIGYDEDKMVVIPNGFDVDRLRPDPTARQDVRHALGIPAEALVIGLVGRFHPQKDHRTFVEAARRLSTVRPETRFVLCGEQVTWDNTDLSAWIDEAGLRPVCHLLGRREDVPRVMASFDLATSTSSYGESFANVVSEAMSCGVPCVVTNVGDSAHIVGETGVVVPPKDPVALARAWGQMLELGTEQIGYVGAAARARVQRHFNLPQVVARYEALFEELACGARR